MTTEILVPISPGELLDKITILRIKSARITDAAKLANVRRELDLLERTWRESHYARAHDVSADERALQEVNERLWDIEDRIRDKERDQAFDAQFVSLARGGEEAHQHRARLVDRRREELRQVPVTSEGVRPLWQAPTNPQRRGIVSPPVAPSTSANSALQYGHFAKPLFSIGR
jgi:hypothetical protein